MPFELTVRVPLLHDADTLGFAYEPPAPGAADMSTNLYEASQPAAVVPPVTVDDSATTNDRVNVRAAYARHAATLTVSLQEPDVDVVTFDDFTAHEPEAFHVCFPDEVVEKTAVVA